jgi:hypothetical protein
MEDGNPGAFARFFAALFSEPTAAPPTAPRPAFQVPASFPVQIPVAMLRPARPTRKNEANLLISRAAGCISKRFTTRKPTVITVDSLSGVHMATAQQLAGELRVDPPTTWPDHSFIDTASVVRQLVADQIASPVVFVLPEPTIRDLCIHAGCWTLLDSHIRRTTKRTNLEIPPTVPYFFELYSHVSDLGFVEQ